jgi:RNA polymerase sigma-70 factor (ECF subfamily)
MTAPDKTPGSSRTLSYTEFVSLSDELLMVHLGHGHPDALAVLFDRYHRLVLKVALRILRDAGEAEDVMQNVFMEIYKVAAHFDPAKGRTKVWILQYAYHRSFNRRHYLNLRGFYEHSGEALPAGSGYEAEPHQALSVLESGRLVEEALQQLSAVQSEIVKLAFYEGLTMREIAARTDASFDSVRHHYYRGLEKLRSVLCGSPKARRERSSGGEGIAHAHP